MRFFVIAALGSAVASTVLFYLDRDSYPLISGRDAGHSFQDRDPRKKPAVGSKQASVHNNRPPFTFPLPMVKVQEMKVRPIKKSPPPEETSDPIFPQAIDQFKTGCKEAVDGVCKVIGTAAGALHQAVNRKGPPGKPKAKK